MCQDYQKPPPKREQEAYFICSNCNGAGEVKHADSKTETCYACGGRGKVIGVLVNTSKKES